LTCSGFRAAKVTNAKLTTAGWAALNGVPVSTPVMIRYGEMTEDELFVSAGAAGAGITIENRSGSDPLVMLKHFGPGNPDAPKVK